MATNTQLKKIKLKNLENIVLISDIHFGIRNASVEWLENMTGYFNNFFFPLLNKIKEETPNSIVIIAGDYFDNRQSLDLNVMGTGIDIMESMSEILPVYIINGNHDVYRKNDNTINSLKVLRPIKNTHVITDNTVLETEKHKFLLFPWSGDIKGDFATVLNLPDDIDYAIMHEDIKSLIYDNGRQIVSGFDSSTFKGKKIYSGHIHKRQESDKVTYIGSPYQLKRSDIGNTKGIYVLNVKENDVAEKFYPNDYSPKFLKLIAKDIVDLPHENLVQIMSNNYVDIIIKRTELNTINVSDLMKRLDECGAKKIEVILDNSEMEQILSEESEVSKDLTIEDITKSKINKLDIPDEEKAKIIKLNEQYIAASNELIDN